MNNTSESRACHCVGMGLIVYLGLAATIIACVHLNFLPILAKMQLFRSHVMCGGFGMLGAAIAAIRKYYRTLITESTAKSVNQPLPPSVWDFGWNFYYLTRPLLGSILGSLTYTLSFVGFQVLATSPDVQISSKGKYLIYALSLVAGYSVSQALDRLSAVAKRVFQSELKNP